MAKKKPRKQGDDAAADISPGAASNATASKEATTHKKQQPVNHLHNNKPNQTAKQNKGTGDITAHAAGGAPAAEPTRVGERPGQAEKRWRKEGIDLEVAAFRTRVREDLKEHHGYSKGEAHAEAWKRALAKYPPPGVAPADPPDLQGEGKISPSTPIQGDSGQVKGLQDVPRDWGELAENASLQAELAWVQSNRLVVVEERGNISRVHLDRARSPAPSWAALGWLETSIRSYAKYVDVVARSLSNTQDHEEDVRRERMAIAEIRELLDEMHRDRDEG